MLKSKISKTIFIGVITGLFVFILVSLYQTSRESSELWIAQKNDKTDTETNETTDFCLDVPVVFYHHIQPLDETEEKGQRALSVAPANFERDLIYLKNQGYTFITLKELVDAVIQHRNMKNVVAIVLDDGYRDNYTYAYPIAKRQEADINIGMITGLAGHEEHLTWGMIQDMANSGYIHFYNHSWSHMALSGENESNITLQIENAQNQLEDRGLTDSKILIYPYGKNGITSKKVLESLDYRAAFTVDEGTMHCESNLLTLPRLRTGNAGVTIHNL